MATLTITTPSGFATPDFATILGDSNIVASSRTSESFRMTDANGNVITVKGSGFTYGANNLPASGSISEIKLSASNQDVAGLLIPQGETIDAKEFADALTALEAGIPLPYYSLFEGLKQLIVGGPGGDTLQVLDFFLNTTNDIGRGGRGNDLVDLGYGNDLFLGQAGNDVLQALVGFQTGPNRDTFDGGVGVDTVEILNASPSNAVRIDLNLTGFQDTGIDFAKFLNVENLDGDVENDIFIGNNFNNSFFGDLGDDRLGGGRGNDRLDGGEGNDNLIGGGGSDVAFGRGGNDIINGGIGGDLLNGGDGNDRLLGGAGNDRIFGGNGRDVVIAGGGNDTVRAGKDGANTQGGAGDDILTGGKRNDTFQGGAGNDLIYGGGGNDSLSGQDDNDTLNGGTGADKLNGGKGNDQFRMTAGHGNDTITGYSSTDDTLNFKGITGVDDFSDLTITGNGTATVTVQTGDGTITLEAPAGGTITLNATNVTFLDLD